MRSIIISLLILGGLTAHGFTDPALMCRVDLYGDIKNVGDTFRTDKTLNVSNHSVEYIKASDVVYGFTAKGTMQSTVVAPAYAVAERTGNVVIALGEQDVADRTSPEQFKRHLFTLASMSIIEGRRVLLVAPMADDENDTYKGVVKELAKELKIPVVDALEWKAQPYKVMQAICL